MHFAWQSTSPVPHALRQATSEDTAASEVVAETTEVTIEEATSVDWALASRARAPTTRKRVKRILIISIIRIWKLSGSFRFGLIKRI